MDFEVWFCIGNSFYPYNIDTIIEKKKKYNKITVFNMYNVVVITHFHNKEIFHQIETKTTKFLLTKAKQINRASATFDSQE